MRYCLVQYNNKIAACLLALLIHCLPSPCGRVHCCWPTMHQPAVCWHSCAQHLLCKAIMLFECRRTQWRNWSAQAMLILLQSTLMACDVAMAGPGEKWQVSQAQVAKAFKELAAGATDVPLPDCKWTLQNAPKTFYAPRWILNGSATMRLHASIHLPAAGYTRVKQPTAALWIVTGVHYYKLI